MKVVVGGWTVAPSASFSDMHCNKQASELSNVAATRICAWVEIVARKPTLRWRRRTCQRYARAQHMCSLWLRHASEPLCGCVREKKNVLVTHSLSQRELLRSTRPSCCVEIPCSRSACQPHDDGPRSRARHGSRVCLWPHSGTPSQPSPPGPPTPAAQVNWSQMAVLLVASSSHSAVHSDATTQDLNGNRRREEDGWSSFALCCRTRASRWRAQVVARLPSVV